MTNSLQESNPDITVLELRNYLLNPGMTDSFINYFNTHFVNPMKELGGHTVGQFKIDGVNDRFVWMRGFTNLKTRSKFLTDFYVNSRVWKQFGPGANDMMINSDNVYLLRPLPGHKQDQSRDITTCLSKTAMGVTVADFYICNSTLDKVINLFDTAYLPFLKTAGINNSTLWVSEMSENDFPRLPVFQDKNLLFTLTSYPDETDYQLKKQQINPIPADLKRSMQELITTQSQLILYPVSSTL